MALTYDEKVDKLKLDRSIAISAKDAVTTARADALSEDQYNNFYLHGDSEYIGVNDLIWYHNKEREETGGVVYDRPALGDSIGNWSLNWDILIQLALEDTGDGVWGLYPPDENGKAQDEVNYESTYLNLNGGDTIPNPKEGLIGYLQDASDAAGDSGSGDSYHSGDSYEGTTAAENAAKLKLYNSITAPGSYNDTARLGSGLLGRRTCNINITTSAGTESGYYLYIIGDDGAIDDDDFYADNTGDANSFLGTTAYKTLLTSSLSNIITYGDSVSAYQTALQGLEAGLRKIQGLDGDTNTFFRDTGMNLEIGDSAANVNALLSTLSDKIGDSGDTWPGDTNFWAFYNYFNDAGVVVGDSYFNPGLRAIKSFSSSLKTTLNTRFGNLEKRGDSGILGDTYITGEGDFTKERKWRVFWLKSRVAKPKSSQFDYIGLGEAVTGATNQVTEWDSQLNILLGSDLADHLEFIKTPTLYATYYDPKTDKDDGHVIQRKVSMVYNGQQHATHYWIYRQDVPAPGAISITNDQWDVGDSSLVGYWPFDEASGTTTADLSGNGNDGTLEGSAPTFVGGKMGNAVNFPGTDERIDCGTAAPLDDIGNGDFSISFWMKSKDAVPLAYGALFFKYQDSTNWFVLRSYDTNNRLHFQLEKADTHASIIFSTASAPFDATWHHVVLTVNRTTDLALLYIDAVKDSTEGDVSAPATDASNTGNLLEELTPSNLLAHCFWLQHPSCC